MKANIRVDKNKIDIDLPLVFWQEGEYTIAFCPPLELAAQGEDREDALNSFQDSLKLFFRHIRQNGTLHEVLTECGFKRIGDGKKPHWQGPQISGFIQNKVAV